MAKTESIIDEIKTQKVSISCVADKFSQYSLDEWKRSKISLFYFKFFIKLDNYLLTTIYKGEEKTAPILVIPLDFLAKMGLYQIIILI